MDSGPEITAHLDVYDGKEGLWAPEHGVLEMPEGWEFLPSGDAFVTRRVKAAGTYWLLWRPRGRNRPHRRLLGVLAPASAIEEARAQAALTEQKRAAQRVQGAAYRERKEVSYREELERAILQFLSFAPEHAALAKTIAADAARRAAEVGSGHVGRTKTLPIEERAALAARAAIRHGYTDYEEQLDEKFADGSWDDDDLYREVKASSQEAVDQFLHDHRPMAEAPRPGLRLIEGGLKGGGPSRRGRRGRGRHGD